MPTSDELNAFLDALGGVLTAFRDAFRQQLKAAGIDLTSEMLPVMRYLWGHDGANQQEIANAVSRDKATLTAMIDNLVRRELVTRCEDSQDRRSKRIVLTAKGRELEQRVVPVLDAILMQAARHVATSQLRTSIGVLELMNKNLKEPQE